MRSEKGGALVAFILALGLVALMVFAIWAGENVDLITNSTRQAEARAREAEARAALEQAQARLQEAQAAKIRAEGDRELHTAAAYAIKTNADLVNYYARRGDTRTAGTVAAALLGAVVLHAARVILRRLEAMQR